jgi:hypothetical protein
VNVSVGTASIAITGLTTTATVDVTSDTELDPANRLYWLSGYRLMSTTPSGGAACLSYIYLDARTGTIQIYLGGIALSSGVTGATFLVYYTYTS